MVNSTDVSEYRGLQLPSQSKGTLVARCREVKEGKWALGLPS